MPTYAASPPTPVVPSTPQGTPRKVLVPTSIDVDRVRPSAGGMTVTKVSAPATLPTVAPALLPAQGTKRLPVTFAVVTPQAFGAFAEVIIPDSVFEQAQKAADRRPIRRVEIDWTDEDFTGLGAVLTECVRSLEIERSIVGELPEEAGLVDGYSVGTAKLVLEGTRPGADMMLAEELSPFRPDSPLYDAARVTPMGRIDLGLLTELGPKLYRQITGPIRTIAISESTQRVTLSMVDPAERLREAITFPTYGEFASHANRRPWALTVNTQWVVDHVLRRNGVYCSPPARGDAIVSCTGHGGLVAEVGYNDAPISINASAPPTPGLWVDDDHPFGMLGTPEGPDQNGTAGYQQFYGITDGKVCPLKFQQGYGGGLSGWLHMGSYMTGSAAAENRVWHIRPTVNDYPRLFVNGFGNGELYAGLSLNASTIVSTPRFRPGAARWHHLGVHFRWTSNTTLEVRVRLDGATTTYTLTHAAVNVQPTAFFDGYKPTTEVRGHLFRSWSNFQFWPAYAPPTLAEWQALENHVPEADVGRGLNELLYLPDVASADSFEVLKAAVGAEYGVHGFDITGRYYFRPRTDQRPPEVDIELDVLTDITDVAYSYSSDSVRNVVGYSVTPKYHRTDGKGPRSESVVVKAEDPYQFTVPAGKIYYYEVDWPWGATGWRGGILPYHGQKGGAYDANVFKEWGADIVHGWTYSTKGASGNWTILDNVQSVVVGYCQITARTALITVDNSTGAKDIRLATAMPADATSDGEPALRIGGWPLVDMPAHVGEYRDEASIAKYRGPRAYQIPTSPYRQTPLVLDPMSARLVGAMAEATTVLEDLPVRGDPRTQSGMVARLKFRGEGSAPVYGTVLKTNRGDGDAGLVDKISVRPLPVQSLAPAGWTFYLDISHYQFEGAVPIDLARARSLGYGGLVAKIGQGAGHTTVAGVNGNPGTPATYGQTIDAYWATCVVQGPTLWPDTFAGYWYIGNDETPASQAARCKAALGGRLYMPIMMDWEDGGGTFANVQAVVAAFRAAGLNVTTLYCGSGYVTQAIGGGNPTNIDSLGLHVIRARYWTNDSGHPRFLFDDITDPAAFGLAPFAGATPDAFQFTQYGVIYPGMSVDVNAIPGSERTLGNLLGNRPLNS